MTCLTLNRLKSILVGRETSNGSKKSDRVYESGPNIVQPILAYFNPNFRVSLSK